MFIHGIFAFSSAAMLLSVLITGNSMMVIWVSAVFAYSLFNFLGSK